ncbi:ATP-binding cassette domain-containing protein, partial [Salmonella enterica subsp. enterica serovar Typhimurium]|nr:ATP-binding cassette domain-containing protein [Salmonella enterica subsp. enterica serovar Typhimurium]
MTALLPAASHTAEAPKTAGSAQPVRLDGIARSFPLAQGRREVLRGLDLDIAAGEIVAVVGPSGCGKSTLLRLIGGLDTPTRGTFRLDGSGVADVDERTAIAFQEPRLLPWRTL